MNTNQENPFPDFVPEVGEVVRITGFVSNPEFVGDLAHEAQVIFRNINSTSGAGTSIIIGILCQAHSTESIVPLGVVWYWWSYQNKIWHLYDRQKPRYQQKKEDGYEIKVLKRRVLNEIRS